MDLNWHEMQVDIAGVQAWGARNEVSSYVITRDERVKKSSPIYEKFCVSTRRIGGTVTRVLGVSDTLEGAKRIAGQDKGD